MLRIPNPGSDIDGFLRIFRDLYPFLRDKASFTLDEVTAAMIAKRNVTSQGAIGDEALRRSTREDRSRDPLYNQSKMYAELYRTLGWIHSTDSNLRFCLTALGHHMATAADPAALMKECLLGIAYPNEILDVKGQQTIRVFGAILQAIASLQTLSRDEMMAGPMSMGDDSRPELVDAMIADLRRMRETKGALDKRLNRIAKERGISRSPTMENYTRYPMAALPWAGWATKTKPGVLAVTEQGRRAAERVRSARDLRLRDFRQLEDRLKGPLIVASSYRKLERGGFDVAPVHELMVREERALYDVDVPNGPLFSPFQQLSRQTIEQYAPEMITTEGIDATSGEQRSTVGMAAAPRDQPSSRILVQITDQANAPVNRANRVVENLRGALRDAQGRIPQAADHLARRYQHAGREMFYPLVADLFTVLGFDCQVSRPGVNYARADAMIFDPQESIPSRARCDVVY